MARKYKDTGPVDLDVTSFMNLMIVLVPVLLLNMVLSFTTVLEIKLPGGGDSDPTAEEKENRQIELIIRSDRMTLNFPAGIHRATIEKQGEQHDYKKLTEKLKDLKHALRNQDDEELRNKKDILILSEDDTEYQTLVSAMDAVRSYDAVVITDVVMAELFPDISLGDAPVIAAANDGGEQP